MHRSDSDRSSSSKTALRECLASSIGLPHELLSLAYQSYKSCDSWVWLLDNSSRVKVRDSHVGRRGEEKGSIERVDDVMRWEELHECVAFHTKMASQCWIPTKYWLVNDPASYKMEWQQGQKFSLCCGSSKDVASEMNKISHVLNDVPLD